MKGACRATSLSTTQEVLAAYIGMILGLVFVEAVSAPQSIKEGIGFYVAFNSLGHIATR